MLAGIWILAMKQHEGRQDKPGVYCGLLLEVQMGARKMSSGGCFSPLYGQKAATAGSTLSQYLGEMYFLYFLSESGVQDQTWGTFNLFPPKLPVQGRERGADAAAKKRPKSGKELNFYFLPVLPNWLSQKRA